MLPRVMRRLLIVAWLLAPLVARADGSSIAVRAWEIANPGHDTTMPIPIERSGDDRDGALVTVITKNASAIAGQDYRRIAATTRYTIRPGQSSAVANVPVLGEPGPQSDKQFYLQVQRAVSTGGPASFAAPQFTESVSPRALQVADLNHDGLPDLVTINTTEGPGHSPAATLKVLLNASAPGAAAATFMPVQSISLGANWLYTLAITDLNRDGKPDIVAVDDHFGHGLAWLNTTAAGAKSVTLGPARSFMLPSPLVDVIAADLDGDGLQDLVVLAQSNEIATVLNRTEAGAATATFLPYALATIDEHGANLASADIDGDGKVDVLVNGPASNAVQVLRNSTASGDDHATFSAPVAIPIGGATTQILVDDVDHDGRPDIVASPVGSAVAVSRNLTNGGDATLTFAAPELIATPEAPGELGRADLNRDGILDLFTSIRSRGTVSVLFNFTRRGDASLHYVQRSFRITSNAGEPVAAVGKGDLNRDGAIDLVVQTGARIATLINTVVPPTFSTTPVPQVIHYPAPQ